MAGLLEGKRGVITGGGSGMGQQMAVRFTEEGAKVLICGRTLSKLEETAALVHEKNADAVCEIAQCDVTEEEQVKALVDKAVALFGGLDFFVNGAAIETVGCPIFKRPKEQFEEIIKADLYSVFYGVKHAGAYMVEHGGGSIVNMSSGAGAVGVGDMEPYAAAKAAVNNLTQSAAIGMGPYGVRVNAVLPGMTLTPMIRQFKAHYPDFAKQMENQIPLGRMAEPVEQANAALFLASDLSSDVTGALLKVDGGYQAGYYTKKES